MMEQNNHLLFSDALIETLNLFGLNAEGVGWK